MKTTNISETRFCSLIEGVLRYLHPGNSVHSCFCSRAASADQPHCIHTYVHTYILVGSQVPLWDAPTHSLHDETWTQLTGRFAKISSMDVHTAKADSPCPGHSANPIPKDLTPSNVPLCRAIHMLVFHAIKHYSGLHHCSIIPCTSNSKEK